MTTAGIHSKTPPASDAFILPDAPLSQDEKMTNARHLSETGQHHHLVQYLGSPETTIVSSERYVVTQRTSSMAGSHYPDLLVVFDADPAAYEARNGYIIEEQGKPPDFVMEVASRSTRHVDTGAKRVAYARQGIPEYWRFDETGEYHRTRLAGDRLVNGRYETIDIEELPDGSLQGYSAYWACTCAGRAAGWVGTTRPPGITSPRLTANGNAPMLPKPAPTTPKPTPGIWKQKCAGCAHD